VQFVSRSDKSAVTAVSWWVMMSCCVEWWQCNTSWFKLCSKTQQLVSPTTLLIWVSAQCSQVHRSCCCTYKSASATRPLGHHVSHKADLWSQTGAGPGQTASTQPWTTHPASVSAPVLSWCVISPRHLSINQSIYPQYTFMPSKPAPHFII